MARREQIPDKIRVRRSPKRGAYDNETIYRILDDNYLCHVGLIYNDTPVVIPTLYGRHENNIYLHGSSASRLVLALEEGINFKGRRVYKTKNR